MDNDFFYCCIVFIVFVLLVIGVLCLFYGYKCKSVELRIEYKSDYSKNIYNDNLVKVL